MGNEAGRFCKFASFSRVQRFKGGPDTTVNHIKGSAFTSAVPSKGSADDDAGVAGEVLPPAAIIDDSQVLLLPSTCKAAGSAQDPHSEDFGGWSSSRLDSEEGPNVDPYFPGKQIAHSESDGARDRPVVIQDGETKLMRTGSSEGRVSGRISNRSGSKVGGSSTRLSKGPLKTDISAVPSKPGKAAKPFPKRPLTCKLSQKTWDKLEELFRLMDQDGSSAVTREEAMRFFQGAFSNLSVDAMFNEVDTDSSGAITADEFVKFWVQVRGSGYKEQDILDELAELIEGGAWVDWKDGRDTMPSEVKFPSRPILCRLSAKTWAKCEELFRRMSGNDEKMLITRDMAQMFFKGAWGNISADAMFNEVDVNRHGVINAKDFMNFWVQVKASGYKDKDIFEELDNLLDGSPWVDWKDGRRT
mmetsp:Transcript_78305/g.227134  ORF Transcript_78305/g.227134 Transcript_78305/m.227134 type:complete len:415 (-) Transcript_78305:115-1359(-)|eukprot:CAMPEP_0176061758 /NCGR_PEP_ID=MMETSP0120_2-20121206/30793_1 /TAXON_ID=160619 /ORGANISM="Kryptoperidinium foliaceum, Strain CCMP 1326" /LENGTH=414 /DNA_ID=CAMNT_0017395319 /DNA_START=133 /DNA_END=1377 /DNA_ORIENTATION=-